MTFQVFCQKFLVRCPWNVRLVFTYKFFSVAIKKCHLTGAGKLVPCLICELTAFELANKVHRCHVYR